MGDPLHAYEHVRGIYFPIAIGVFAVVLGTLAILLVAGHRRRTPGGRTEALPLEATYAAALTAVVVVLLVITFRAETPIDSVAARPALRVRVTAAQWSWRFTYPGGRTVLAVSTWRPPVALVPTGQVVEFSGSSHDVIHGFFVPKLQFQRQLLPGYVTRFDLRFDTPGLYPGQCSVYCGEQHSQMHFELRAVPPAQFRRWLAGGEVTGA
jgi:cytochrome c oxidase subunit 2